MEIRLESELAKTAAKIAAGHQCGTYLVAYTNPAINKAVFYVDNYSDAEWATADVVARDPIVAEVHKPIPQSQLWGPDIYIRTKNEDIWEAASAAGLHSGIVVPLHLAEKRRMLVSVACDRALDGSSEYLKQQVRRLEKTAQMFSGVLIDLFDTRIEHEGLLTDQQKEMLCWTFDGMTSADIALRMNRGQMTIMRELEKATRALKATNKIQAAMMYMRYRERKH